MTVFAFAWCAAALVMFACAAIAPFIGGDDDR
jgi:hypothetical protein